MRVAGLLLMLGLLVPACGFETGVDEATAGERGQLTGPPRLELAGMFDQPVQVTSPPGIGRLFVVEQAGRVVEIADGRAARPAFLDLREEVSYGGERGLFALAFAPDYRDSGLLYVSYTDRATNTRVDEFRVDPRDPGRVDPATRRMILIVEQPHHGHNGGLIGFDPSGMLVLGLGDGGGPPGDPANRAQDLSTLLGKLIRIDPRHPAGGLPYGIPEDNPFLGYAEIREEVWGYGLRNPWRWSFDGDGYLYVADVGETGVEEINIVPPERQAGANYGWRKYEGEEVRYPQDHFNETNLIVPALTYPHGDGRCAVTGGGAYQGQVAALGGYYLYADLCEGLIRGFRVDGEGVSGDRAFDLRVPMPVSFGEDAAGDMYVVSLEGGVFRITAG